MKLIILGDWNAGRIEPYMIVNTVYLLNFIIFVIWRTKICKKGDVGYDLF